MNICWKFHGDISNSFRDIADLLKNSGDQWPTFSQSDYVQQKSTERRPLFTRIYQKISNYSNTIWDISLKFSANVHHMTALNWQKNFGHIPTHKSAAPSRMPKFWTTVVPHIFEIFSKKFFGSFLDLFKLPNWRNSKYLQKNSVLKFFR